MKTRKLTIIFCALAFVLILTLLSSLVFTVKLVTAYCYNSKDEQLIADMTAAGEDMRGRNIFTLSEKDNIARMEAALPAIKVVNIERKFPNIVQINFVKLIPVFAFAVGEDAYIAVDNGLMVCGPNLYRDRRDLNFDATVETFDPDPEAGILIPVTAAGAPVSPALRAPLALPGETQNSVLQNFVAAMNRLDYFEYDFLRLIVKMDVSRLEGEAGKLHLTMRKSDKKEQIDIEIWNSASRMQEKAQYAVTLYEKYLRSEIDLPSRAIKVYEDSRKIIHAAV
jgi:hypothetical protein